MVVELLKDYILELGMLYWAIPEDIWRILVKD